MEMMRLLTFLLISAISYSVSAGGIRQVYDYKHTECEILPGDAGRWKAEITLSSPLNIRSVDGGELSYARDDGKYFEMTGTSRSATDPVCIMLQGNYVGHEAPMIHVQISHLQKETDLATREMRSLRIRRATEIWRVSNVPQTSDRRTLLKDFEPYHRQWGDESLSGSKKHSSSPALTVHYAKGSYSKTSHNRGAGFYTTPAEVPDGVTQLILMYDVYFENFGFGNMGKLPGLFGGEKGDGAYACSGGSNPDTCFSLRLMWRQNGDGELYAYIPTNQQSGFHDRPDVIGHSRYGQSIGRGKIKFQNGAWNTVMELVHLNTIGHTDGHVKFCNTVQGHSQQCYTANHLRMRNKSSHYIRGMFFSTFFGGSNPDDAAPNDCHTYFRNFRLQLPTGVVVG